MGNCDGRWQSTVNGEDDGILDLDALLHEHDGKKEKITVACGGGQIVINKTGHVYKGTLESDGLYTGEKKSHKKDKSLDDEPTDGTWTAEKGPGEDDLDLDKGKKKGKTAGKKSGGKKGKKAATKKAGGTAKKKTAKATKKRAQKAVKRGTKKGAKRGTKKAGKAGKKR